MGKLTKPERESALVKYRDGKWRLDWELCKEITRGLRGGLCRSL